MDNDKNSVEQTFDFSNEIQEVQADALMPYVQRDALIWVAKDLDLGEVLEAIASDDSKVVKGWMDQDQVKKVTGSENFFMNREKELFRFGICNPFVFFQELI